MATEVLLVRMLDKLAADNPISLETIQSLNHGEVVKATISRVRNVLHHRKFFALVGLVFRNQTVYATQEQLLGAIKIATGYYDMIPSTLGLVPQPRSISFAKMDQTGFEQFYEKVIEWVIKDVLPGVDAASLRQEVTNFL